MVQGVITRPALLFVSPRRHATMPLVQFREEPAYEYVDVDLEQRSAPIESRWRDLDLTTRFSRHLQLRRPFVSAAMDTVTGSSLAIVMAEEGGLGVLHRFLSIEDQAKEVARVKRTAHFVIDTPYLLTPQHRVRDALAILEEHGIGGIIVVDYLEGKRVLGVLSRRDLAGEASDRSVRELMNAGGKKDLIAAPCGTTMEKAAGILHAHRIEKLPLVDEHGHLCGLITEKDIAQVAKYPNATRDKTGRLAVAAAIGIREDDYHHRASALIEAGVDVLVIDVAHGGLIRVLKVTRLLVDDFPDTDVVVGNVMTAELTEELIDAGAAGVKVGIAPGYACRTRNVTGVGGGQLTAVFESVKVAAKSDVPICADGGIRELGDVGKALAVGGSTVMMGSFFAGTDETPGKAVMGLDRRRYYLYRGMASLGANLSLNQLSEQDGDSVQVTPEGEHLMVPAKGSVRDVLKQMEGALRSTMSYIGATTIAKMPQRAIFRVKAGSGG